MQMYHSSSGMVCAIPDKLCSCSCFLQACILWCAQIAYPPVRPLWRNPPLGYVHITCCIV